MAPTDTSKLVDRIIPGGLTLFLKEAREDGETFADIAYVLRSEHDIEVTSETVRRWCAAYLTACPTCASETYHRGDPCPNGGAA